MCKNKSKKQKVLFIYKNILEQTKSYSKIYLSDVDAKKR